MPHFSLRVPSGLSAYILVLSSALSLPAGESADSAVAPAPGAGARVLEIDPTAFAGSSVNVIAGLQNTLFTQGDTQYAAYYDADGTLMLAKRKVDTTAWQVRATPHKGNVADAHNTVAIAVDGAGYLHASWDHHGHPLNYARGVAPGSLELGPKTPMTGVREERVTYPAFLALPNGDLLFLYRDGASGRGNLVLNRYSVAAGKWANVHPNLVNGEGRRSAYVATTTDARGVLHLAWVWRETPDVATNHDLCYARSEDGGVTWKTSAGAPLPIPLTADSSEYALRIPQNRALMNPPCIATDALGRPFIANYWKPEGSDVPQYHLVWSDGEAWRVRQMTQRKTAFDLSGTSTKRPPISRGVLVVDGSWAQEGRACLIFRDDERGGKVVAVECRADADGPGTLRELTANSVGAWEASFDPGAWARNRQLHLLVQNVVQRDGEDREAAAVPPSPIGVLTWRAFGEKMGKGRMTNDQ